MSKISLASRALQFIPAPTGPWLVRKHFLLANKIMLLARLIKTFIKKNKTFTLKIFFTVTNSVLPAISGPAFLQTSHYIINVVNGIINEPRKL